MSLTLKIVYNGVLHDSRKTSLEKTGFVSYYLTCSQPVILQYFLIIDISGKNQSMPLEFLRGNNHQGKDNHILVVCGLLHLSSNQISGFFDILIFCMELVIKRR